MMQTKSETTSNKNTEEENENSNYECNICLDIARDAVISLCGHLFCWPCLHRWLETRPTRPMCPVCKAGISKDKVIPIYGRDNHNQTDPREKLPPRPQAQRHEPETNFNPFSNFSFGGMGGGFGAPGAQNGIQFSFGIGAFPFTFLSAAFGNTNNNNQAPVGSQQAQEEQFLSRAFLWIAFFFFLWLILA